MHISQSKVVHLHNFFLVPTRLYFRYASH